MATPIQDEGVPSTPGDYWMQQWDGNTLGEPEVVKCERHGSVMHFAYAFHPSGDSWPCRPQDYWQCVAPPLAYDGERLPPPPEPPRIINHANGYAKMRADGKYDITRTVRETTPERIELVHKTLMQEGVDGEAAARLALAAL